MGKLLADVRQVESSSYSILANGKSIEVKFMFAELPNDMKMLSFLAGEPIISATYFSTFADVDKEFLSLNGMGTFGKNASNTFKPWKYSDNIKVVKAVEKFKRSTNVSARTKGSNTTSFIASRKTNRNRTLNHLRYT